MLIGPNASGKSNALDALAFLARATGGIDLHSALVGSGGAQPLLPIRGGLEWASLRPGRDFELSATVGVPDERTEYEYTLSVATDGSRASLLAESLTRIKYRPKTRSNPYRVKLFWTDPAGDNDPSITARLYNESRGAPRQVSRSMTILHQLTGLEIRKEIVEGLRHVGQALSQVFILDPSPRAMRDYSQRSESLEADGSNVAGVLLGLPQERRGAVTMRLTDAIRQLPESEIQRCWAEPVGKFESDAMLYCDEGSGREVDARGLSDGTLRLIAIVTALLIRPSGSLLVIEEVDNGLHPSRAKLLLSIIREIGSSRGVDVLVTTHNPALLDAMGTQMVPFVVVSHRDADSGNSRLTLLEDVPGLAKLLAGGSLGDVASSGALEQRLFDVSQYAAS